MRALKRALQDDNLEYVPVTFRKYLVLAGVTAFAAAGDSMLAQGMKQAGNISLHHLPSVL